jgi:hypothetical protein
LLYGGEEPGGCPHFECGCGMGCDAIGG